MPVRRCLTCRREIRSGTRCPQCERNRRPSGGARYPWQYQRNRAELLATGPPCHYYGAPGSKPVVGPAAGRPVCRRCIVATRNRARFLLDLADRAEAYNAAR